MVVFQILALEKEFLIYEKIYGEQLEDLDNFTVRKNDSQPI